MSFNYYHTASLNIAAWLISKDIPLKDSKRIDKQMIFYFEKTNELNNAISEYLSNESLKKFITSFKKVKEIVNS
jgi:hypothetical protein